MNFSDNIIKKSEMAVFRLRELFREYGYERYEMSKFEEYELYAANRNFLGSDDIITFTDTGGKLRALRPDVTLSIVKNTKNSGNPGQTRLYYDETIYRRSGLGHELRERVQSGIEYIGSIGIPEMSEVVLLAVKSLNMLTKRSCIDLSHMGLLGGLLDGFELPDAARTKLLQRIGERNLPELERLIEELELPAECAERLVGLFSLGDGFETAITRLEKLCFNDKTKAAAAELRGIYEGVISACPEADIRLDFSVVNDVSYYDGVIFQGYAEGIPSAILSGGRYDSLMRKFGRRKGAIGFAVYVDILEQGEQDDGSFVNIALPKGRLGETVYAMFEKAGYGCPGILDDSRKLVFENEDAGVRYFWVKPSDVAIYVERGAADIGVVGSDILLEHLPEVYELCDLGVGICRLVVAAPEEFVDERSRELRVATKFANIAKSYYSEKSRAIDVIALNGSIEIAPLLGLSDVIVDIVESGKTLRENGLEVKEEICGVSARLISNKTSFNFKHAVIVKIAEGLDGVKL